MSTQPDPWASRGPLDDALQIVAEVLGEYREQGIEVDARLRDFAQQHLRGQRWVREATPWTRIIVAREGESWGRASTKQQELEPVCHIYRDRERWYTTRRRSGLFPEPIPCASRDEAMRLADGWALDEGWLLDPTLPSEAPEVGEGQREEEPDYEAMESRPVEGRGRAARTQRSRPQGEEQRCPHGYNNGLGCFFCERGEDVETLRGIFAQGRPQVSYAPRRPLERGESRPLDGSPSTYSTHDWGEELSLDTEGRRSLRTCNRCLLERRGLRPFAARRWGWSYWRDGQRLRTAGRCEPSRSPEAGQEGAS